MEKVTSRPETDQHPRELRKLPTLFLRSFSAMLEKMPEPRMDPCKVRLCEINCVPQGTHLNHGKISAPARVSSSRRRSQNTTGSSVTLAARTLEDTLRHTRCPA